MTDVELLYDWEVNIPTFFLWLEDACSIHRESELYKSLCKSITTNDDLDLFVQLFDGDFENIDRTAEKYLMRYAC